jgi:hypothetical protein
MFYTIYKITNKINNKFYIGMHKTENLDDSYMGSGKLLKKAINKYGIDNFTKEILHVFDNEEDMKIKEKELVILNEMSYNLCEGGKGGWSFVNRCILSKEDRRKRGKKTYEIHKQRGTEKDNMIRLQNLIESNPEIKEKRKQTLFERYGSFGVKAFSGKSHKEETKKIIGLKNSIHQSGIKNSQYGTCWITNGIENKKIKKEELDKWIEFGYYKGRIIS